MTLGRIIPVYTLAWPFWEEVFKVCRTQIRVAHPPPVGAKNVSLSSGKLGNTHPNLCIPLLPRPVLLRNHSRGTNGCKRAVC